MTRLYDGVAGLLSDVFGSPVTRRRSAAADVVMDGVFRAQPVEITSEDGRVTLDVAPTLRVTSPAAAQIVPGDQILPGDGRTYRVINRQPGGSPATDAFVVFVLELLP